MKQINVRSVEIIKTKNLTTIKADIEKEDDVLTLKHGVTHGEDVKDAAELLKSWLSNKVNCMMAYGKGSSLKELWQSSNTLNLECKHKIPKEWVVYSGNLDGHC